jgi:hypothetical protein
MAMILTDCIDCGAELSARARRSYPVRCPSCRPTYERQRRLARYIQRQPSERICKVCEGTFFAKGRRLCCSPGCTEENARSLRRQWFRDDPRRRGLQPQYRRHGLTKEQFAALGDRCMVCGVTDDLHIDHDHRCCPGKYSCGKCVRGLLCSGHNNGIGRFGDDAMLLRAAADYLDRADAKTAAETGHFQWRCRPIGRILLHSPDERKL